MAARKKAAAKAAEKKAAAKAGKKRPKTDQEILQDLKDRFLDQIKKGEIKLKVGDLLKILEIQKKLASDSSAEEKFWEIIEQIRQEELKDA